jgi:hypothetical protein
MVTRDPSNMATIWIKNFYFMCLFMVYLTAVSVVRAAGVMSPLGMSATN